MLEGLRLRRKVLVSRRRFGGEGVGLAGEERDGCGFGSAPWLPTRREAEVDLAAPLLLGLECQMGRKSQDNSIFFIIFNTANIWQG
jgi:hypothetical protein